MKDVQPAMQITRPLQTLELLVLSVLTDGALHGYGLVTALRERSDGALRVRPGNLYRVLDRLSNAGLLEAAIPPPSMPRGAERTRGFAITDAGRERLVRETRIISSVLGRSEAVKRALEENVETAS